MPAGRALANRLGSCARCVPYGQRWRRTATRNSTKNKPSKSRQSSKCDGEHFQTIYPIFRPRRERWFDVDRLRKMMQRSSSGIEQSATLRKCSASKAPFVRSGPGAYGRRPPIPHVTGIVVRHFGNPRRRPSSRRSPGTRTGASFLRESNWRIAASARWPLRPRAGALGTRLQRRMAAPHAGHVTAGARPRLGNPTGPCRRAAGIPLRPS